LINKTRYGKKKENREAILFDDRKEEFVSRGFSNP
jgi:hypothetical protein